MNAYIVCNKPHKYAYFLGERLLATFTRGVFICLDFVINGRQEQVYFWAFENISSLQEKDFIEQCKKYLL